MVSCRHSLQLCIRLVRPQPCSSDSESRVISLSHLLFFSCIVQADSGYDAALYSALSVAPVLLLDGRPKGTSEHAGFAQLAAAGGVLRCCLTLLCIQPQLHLM
jgi:hypothetical protein